MPVSRLRDRAGAGLMTVLAVLAGLLTAAAIVVLARRLRAEPGLYALGLVALPLFYAGFAALGDAPAVVAAELQAGIPYFVAGGLLMASGRRHPRATLAVTGLLWLLHGGYDLVHPQLFLNPGVPAWYPPYCAGVDVALGLYLPLLAFSRRGTA